MEKAPLQIARKLRGELAGLHRAQVGNKRMIILINEHKKTVDVLEIGPRGDIYK